MDVWIHAARMQSVACIQRISFQALGPGWPRLPQRPKETPKHNRFQANQLCAVAQWEHPLIGPPYANAVDVLKCFAPHRASPDLPPLVRSVGAYCRGLGIPLAQLVPGVGSPHRNWAPFISFSSYVFKKIVLFYCVCKRIMNENDKHIILMSEAQLNPARCCIWIFWRIFVGGNCLWTIFWNPATAWKLRTPSWLAIRLSASFSICYGHTLHDITSCEAGRSEQWMCLTQKVDDNALFSRYSLVCEMLWTPGFCFYFWCLWRSRHKAFCLESTHELNQIHKELHCLFVPWPEL